MLSKSQIKFINALSLKKNREKEGLFIAEGEKMVEELLNSPIKIRQIFSSRNFQHSIFSNHIEIIRITEAELKKISSLSTPNHVLALCEVPTYTLEPALLKGKLVLVLDALQDPGNLGTIIRIADWFGIENIVCSADTVDTYNPKVVQSTMGSIARVKVHHTDLHALLAKAREQDPLLKIYGALLDGENIYGKKLSSEGFIIIGNESKGISADLFPLINEKIKIPSYSHATLADHQAPGPESLNAAVASAVICAEFRRIT